MLKSEFKIGLPVIINCTDRPFVGLIAVCESLKDGVLTCKYLTEYPSMRECFASKERLEFVTKVSDFGVELEIVGDYIAARNEAGIKNTAKYEDGKPRFWQGDGRVSEKLNKVALSLYLKYLER